MWEQILPGLRIKIFFTILLGVIYPLAMTGISQLIFPKQSNGSLITARGKVMFKASNAGHLMSTKNGNRRRKLRRKSQIAGPIGKRMLIAVLGGGI